MSALALLVLALCIITAHGRNWTTKVRSTGDGSCGGAGPGGVGTAGCSRPAALLHALLDEPLTDEPPDDSAGDSLPARAKALVRGEHVRLDALPVGTRVATGSGSESFVFRFVRTTRTGVHPFVRLCTPAGPLTVGPGRVVYVGRGAVAATAVRRGDFLRLANGSQVRVDAVWRAFDHGMFNPQTLNGDIVVDGFVVSAHTVPQVLPVASALMAPFRFLVGSVSAGGGYVFEDADVGGFVRAALAPALRAAVRFEKSLGL